MLTILKLPSLAPILNDHALVAVGNVGREVPRALRRSFVMPKKIPLTFAISDQPHTRSLIEGNVEIEGVDATFEVVKPQIAAFRRMVRNLEFDVCELASTTYFIARAHGYPFVALPIFLSRRFHHGGLLVRPDSGIDHPIDLEGKRVGVRAYSVTTGVWSRAILMDEFGLDSDAVTWVVDDEEHVQELQLPRNIVQAPAGLGLAAMMANGALAAGFAGNAGVGRTGSPTEGWNSVEANYPDLLPNASELEADWYRRTGIYPIHGTLVVKSAILDEHPWVARSLFQAFTRAKSDWLAKLDTNQGNPERDRKYSQLRRIVGADPLPFGLDVNLPTILALEETAYKQHLIPKRLSVEDLFFESGTG